MTLELKDIITLIASFGALVFSFLNYRRSRKYENENHIFKLKIELYYKIITEANGVLNGLNLIARQGQDAIQSNSGLAMEKLNELAKVADRVSFEFDDFVIVNCLIVPEKILIRINQFSKKLLEDANLYGEYSESKNPLDNIDKFIDELYLDIAEIAELFREDLNVDKLNTSLWKRLRR